MTRVDAGRADADPGGGRRRRRRVRRGHERGTCRGRGRAASPCAPSKSTRLPSRERAVDEQRRVGDVRPQPLGVALVPLGHLLELERRGAVDALQPDVLLGERDLDLLAQDLRVEAGPGRGSRAGRTCPRTSGRSRGASSRSGACRAAARSRRSSATCHGMIRCALPESRTRLGRDAARLEVVELLDEDLRVDDAAGAEHALLAPQDPRGHVLELVRLAVGDDRVARVGAALVAADEVGVLGEQVDDLALALVAPLRADDDCRGHDASVCLTRQRSGCSAADIGARRCRCPRWQRVNPTSASGRRCPATVAAR